MTEAVQKRVYLIKPDVLRDVTVIEHHLGPDIIVQLHGRNGRVLDARIDVTATSVIIHFEDGVAEQLKLMIIG